jgi:hypothetical protein
MLPHSSMPRRSYIEALKKAIRAMHGCGARHFTTVPVTEMSRGKVVWQGDVEVFDLIKHPQAQTCYAWSDDVNGTTQTIAMLGLPPVDSAEAAVKMAMSAKAKGK